MPEFEGRKQPVQITKHKKKENLLVAMIKNVFPHKGDSKGDIIRKIIFLLAIVILIYALCAIIYFYTFRDTQIDRELERWRALKDENHTDDIISISIKDNSGDGGSTTVDVLEEYVDFYNENPDFVGWVEIYPYINNPVVQSTDNDFYLKHNFDRQPTENGTIFADYECNLTPDHRTANVILYGHNLITHNYFQPLSYYRSKGIDFLKENYIINFDTLYNRGQYVIFSVMLVNTKEEHGEVFDYQNDITFSSETEFNEFIGECLDRSYYYTGVNVKYGDELLTLSTCDFSMFSDMRLVVVARKLRNNESPVLNTDEFIDNYGFDEDGNVKRKMFESYYESYNCQWAGRNWDSAYVG